MYSMNGRILRADLSAGQVTEEPVAEATRFLGGRGLAAWYAWNELSPDVGGFDADNRLMFMTGPLTGTLAPSSGRFEVCGIAPQAYPKPHYTRSSVGGHWGPALKYAGYDGLIVQGKADGPTYLHIEDGRAEIRDATDLWGLDSFETQRRLIERHGMGTEVMCIGPSGENLVRIAVIQSGLENAAAQGGFGAVMGSKKLKAISARGTGAISVANPGAFVRECAAVHKLIEERVVPRDGKIPAPGPGIRGCTMACTPKTDRCALQIERTADGRAFATHCCSSIYLRYEPREAALRAADLANRYGLNHWEMTLGYGGIKDSWFNLCHEAGVLTDEDFGMSFEPRSAEFWCEIIRMIAYREGIGDILAEGIPRAADLLGKGHDLTPHVAHGYQTHWDGHLFGDHVPGTPVWPYWLVSALMWATDSRDPLVHGYGQEITRQGRKMSIEAMKKAAKRVYGSEDAVAPDSEYRWKAWPTIWHQNRLAVKDSLPVCDQLFPLIFHATREDGYADIEAEARLYSLATGQETNWAELDGIGSRIYNLERAIMVREGRTRSLDEDATAYFFKPDPRGNTLDPDKFRALFTEFYELRGWDTETGCPTRSTLEEADLADVASELGL